VTNATAADFERMEMCLDRAERAATLDEFELWDAALHQAMAHASHNRFVIRVLDIVTAVREQSEWGKLKDRIVTPERRLKYQEEHRAIVAALKARDDTRAEGGRRSAPAARAPESLRILTTPSPLAATGGRSR
jgi:DNA-binding FadR family transcriptional regulator